MEKKTNCPDELKLVNFLAGYLSAVETARIGRHLTSCAVCSELGKLYLQIEGDIHDWSIPSTGDENILAVVLKLIEKDEQSYRMLNS